MEIIITWLYHSFRLFTILIAFNTWIGYNGINIIYINTKQDKGYENEKKTDLHCNGGCYGGWKYSGGRRTAWWLQQSVSPFPEPHGSAARCISCGIFLSMCRKAFVAVLKKIWLAPTAEMARKRAYDVIDSYAKRFPKAVQCLEDGLEDWIVKFGDVPAWSESFRMKVPMFAWWQRISWNTLRTGLSPELISVRNPLRQHWPLQPNFIFQEPCCELYLTRSILNTFLLPP